MVKRSRTEELWLAADENCDVRLRIVAHSQQQQQLRPVACTVYAPSHLLARIPYFAASLSEPWLATHVDDNQGRAQREITVECFDACVSPQDYFRCLQFLQPHEFNVVIPSVDVALKVLQPADHLLFQECTDECMSYLAAAPWSDAEYVMVWQTITFMGIKPSPDVSSKLELMDDIDIFKDVLLNVAKYPKKDVGKCKAFMDTLQEVARICPSALMEAWISNSTRSAGFFHQENRALWMALTRALLQYGNAEQFVQAFASKSNDFSACSLPRVCLSIDGFAEILSQLFVKAVDTVQTMSNLQCSALIGTWAPAVSELDSEDLTLAFTKFIQISSSVVTQAWMSLTANDVKEMWTALARALLQFGDAKEVLQAFASGSKEITDKIPCTYWIMIAGFVDVLTELFLRVVPGKHETLVLLSNSQRASLVDAWACVVVDMNIKRVTHAFKEVVCSLPPQDPSVVELVKDNYYRDLFEPCFTYWSTSLLRKLRHCDSAQEDHKRIKSNG